MKTKILSCLIFLFLIFSQVSAKEITLKRDGKLKDECSYLANLLERMIAESKGSYRKRGYDFDELKHLKIIKESKVDELYLKLCK